MPWGLRTAACILLGVLLAWGTAAVLLTRSGDGIAVRSAAVEQAGGLVVPGMRVRPDPASREAAWWGGLFFALGLGAALGWCGAVGAAVWVLALRRRPRALAGMAAIWTAVLAWAAWPPGGAAAPLFLLVPIPCFALAVGAMQQCPPRRVSLLAGLVIPLLLLGGAWAHLSRSGGWLDVRDFLLWPHPAGRAIVDGYYRYTLTPAEFIKPLERRQIRTARVVAPGRPDLEASLTDMLRARDYLPVPDDAPLDLVLKADRDALDLERNGRLLLRVPERLFLDSPDWVLSWFSQKADREARLRFLTRIANHWLGPLAWATVFFGLFHALLAAVAGNRTAGAGAGLALLLLGAVILVPLARARPPASLAADPKGLLASERRQDRIYGLRLAANFGFEIPGLPGYPESATDPDPALRYWTAAALGRSQAPGTWSDLVIMLDDPQVNVRCMAFQSLGLRGDPAAVPTIIEGIRSSRDWYVQWYAYRALKHLGWNQNDYR